MGKKVSVIGAAVVDIMAGGVDKELFNKGSVPSKRMEITCGGDALNEAVVLSNLGMDCELITLLGEDEAAETILKYLKENGVSVSKVDRRGDIVTGTNIVLVDEQGERYFITNPDSSLRKLSKSSILPHSGTMGEIVSFASIFVSPMLPVSDMEEVFRAIKSDPGRVLVADMTKAKNGEKITDLKPVLKYVDYIIPNEAEAALLTGEKDPEKNAVAFLEHGAGCAVIKCGKRGCIYADEKGVHHIPAYNSKVVDTTGAGDGFVAGFIYGLANGMFIRDCCKYGNAAASVIVEHMGTGCIKAAVSEVQRRYAEMR